MTRLERSLRRSPGEKSLGPRIGESDRNLDPFTARDADLDSLVLEGIETINLGKGVPDPTPLGSDGGMTPKDGSSYIDPFDMNQEGNYFPKQDGPMWKSINFNAVNVSPRSRRNATPASVNTYLHAEWTEPYWDAVRDETGIWNVPPPPEMEVERAIYDAMKRETLEVGGYGVPFPKYPKESDYYEYETGSRGYVATRIRPSRKFPFAGVGQDASWTNGHPLYHATPTGLLPRIIANGLVGTPDRLLWVAPSPSVWNEQWPNRRDSIQGAPAKGMSFLRISTTEEIDERISRLASLKRSNPDTLATTLAIDSDGNKISVRDSDTKRAATLFGEAILFDDVKIPAANVEVLNQNGQWIPLLETDLSDVVFDYSEDANAGMAKDKDRGIRKIVRKITKEKFGGNEEKDPVAETQVTKPQEYPPVTVQLQPPPPTIGYSNSYGGDDLIKTEQRLERLNHEDLAASGSWSKIHGDHYDWWAYPIDRGSSSYGETFNVAGEPIERLKNDAEFLSSLAREIEIQSLALGWSLYEETFLSELDWEKGQDWRRAYPTRLWKMTRSAQIFGLEREFESLLSLKNSLSEAGISFNHSDYWDNPGTVDDVPSLGKSWAERDEERRQRFSASDATNWTSPYRPIYPSAEGDANVSPKPLPEEDDFLFADEYAETPDFPVVDDAEELADILSESEEDIGNYPYARIDKETRQLIADDIFFAISLLMDGEFPDEQEVDRQESALQMRKYADEQEGLYLGDKDSLYALAEALEDPLTLYEDLAYEGGDDADAGMARRIRGMDEETDFSELALDDPEVQNFIESEVDRSTDDLIFGRSFYQFEISPPGDSSRGARRVRQFSAVNIEDIPENIREDYKKLWNEGLGFSKINRRLGLSEEDGATTQSVLLRSGEITPRIPKKQGPLALPEEAEELFVARYNAGEDRNSLEKDFDLNKLEFSRIREGLRERGLIRTRSEKLFIDRPTKEKFFQMALRLSSLGYMPKAIKEAAMRDLGLSELVAETLFNRFRDSPLRRRSRGGPGSRTLPAEMKRLVELAQLINGGTKKSEIMQQYGLDSRTFDILRAKARLRGLINAPINRRRKRTKKSDDSFTDADSGMSADLVKKITNEEAQLDLHMSLPGVMQRVTLRDSKGNPKAPGRNAIMKPYFLAEHVDVNKMNPDDPVIKSLSPALREAGLGTYPVRGHSVAKVQGPVVKDFVDRLMGPRALADAVLGTFPTADEIVTIYAINALIRARAEYLSESVLNADQVNTAILNGLQVGRSDGGADSGGILWKPSQGVTYDSVFWIDDFGAGPEARYTGTLDPFAYFAGRTDFLKSVVAALPEAVKSRLKPFLTKDGKISSWGDTSFFENIVIREDDKLSRTLAPMVRTQAKTAVDHARRHDELTKKWAQTAYDMMKETGLTDAEVSFVVNEHWVNEATFNLEQVRPGSVMGSAARLGVKALSSRFSPITRSITGYSFGEEEDYGLHEFFHHYLGQGFTRHGEYVAFRGPADMIDSYRGHLQWAWNIHGQLGMFVSKVMSEAFGGGQQTDKEPRVLFDAIARAIYDRLKEMLASPEDRRRIMDQIFPEFLDATTEDEARIKGLIRNQFLFRATRDLPFKDRMPALRLMTAQDLLVPKEYWPYGGESKILYEGRP